MSILFNAKDHSYTSHNESEEINWISVTTVVSHFKKGFDAKLTSEKVSKNKKSKWFGISPEEIQKIWNTESTRSTDLGTLYHNKRESNICSVPFIEKDGFTLPVIKPLDDLNGIKISPIQKLQEGIYPEHLVYLKSVGICGQTDKAEVINNYVNIIDYKTNKEIKTVGYTNWAGLTDKMKSPISHLDDCHINHYALQLSFYMYMILKHNPKLKPGKISVEHITFEIESLDEYGYPITKLDSDNNPIVKEITVIELDYLLDEVLSVIHYMKNTIITKNY